MQKAITIAKKDLHDVFLEELDDLNIDDIPGKVLESSGWGETNNMYSADGRWVHQVDRYQRKDVKVECHNKLFDRDEIFLGLLAFNTLFEVGFSYFPEHSTSLRKC